MVLTHKEKEALAGVVKEAERKTSGEIVVLVVGESGDYRSVLFLCVLCGIALGTLVALVDSRFSWRYAFLEWQLAGAAIGTVFSTIKSVRRLCLGQARLAKTVHEAALAHFLIQGVSETRDRTGILLYVSEFERRVEIVADRAVHLKLGKGFWDSQVAGVCKSLREKKAFEGIGKAVKEMGGLLEHHFPRREDDTNELPNDVR
jgi:putative membrane protein